MKQSFRWLLGSCCVLGLATGSVFGQARMFAQLSTAGAVTAPPAGISFQATGGDMFTLWVLMENSPVNVRGAQATLPCSAVGGTGGSITYVAPPVVNTSNAAYLFFGLGSFPVTDNGTCPVGPPPIPGNPRAATAAGIGVPAQAVGASPKYLGEFVYQVSIDAAGTFIIAIPNEPDSAMRDGSDMPIIFTTSGAEITVPTGSCCEGNPPSCTPDVTDAQCAGTFRAGVDCSVDCHCVVNSDCNDNNACTNDVCAPAGPGDGCSHTPNFPAGQCCNPGNGSLTTIDDGNECTEDSCNTATGAVTNDGAALDGTACTDEGNPCTLDNCLAGACGHNDITAIPCTTDQECIDASGGASQTCGGLAAGFCDCVANPPLSIECLDGAKPNPECFQEGEKVVMQVVLGGGTLAINGGQFRLLYDPSCLQFNGIMAGADCSEGSPFELPIFTSVNEASGEIFYAVGVGLQQNNGNNDGGVMACVSFIKIGECTDCQVCFDDLNPQHTYLSGPAGDLVIPDFPNDGCGCHVQTNGATTVTVPAGGSFNAACDQPTANVSWAMPAAANNTCDGPLDLACTCSSNNPLPWDCTGTIAGGGEFPQGLTSYECCATDSCGQTTCGQWTVFVSDQQAMDVTVQLSPTMTGDQLERCIEFGFYANCVEAPEIFKEVLVFGPPFDFPGHATYEIKVPKGQYACITARDQVHTLRSVSDIICREDGKLEATFKGDPFFGGNWLIGGNLDGSHVIDILDFGVLVSQYLKPMDPNTDCDEVKADGYHHADINGDGIVDMLDYAFIQGNFLAEDKNSCCEDGVAGAGAPILSITVAELRAMGMGDIAVADLNGDGVLDSADMEAFQNGATPAPNGTPKRTSRR